MKFIDIPEDRQREAINTVALQTGLPPSSIEKDWWVTQVLKALHTLPYAEHIAFKGLCVAIHKPLKTNGHPDTARASNNENARMAFSIRVGFV